MYLVLRDSKLLLLPMDFTLRGTKLVRLTEFNLQILG